MFEVDNIAQLFTPCYKTLLRQTILISVVNVVPISLLVLCMFTDSPSWREKNHPLTLARLPCV